MVSCPGSLSVRWTGAFLCGHGDKRGSFSGETKLSLSSRVIWYLSHTTAEIVGTDGGLSLLCVRELWDQWYRTGICSGAFDSSIVPFTPNSSCRPDVSDTEHAPGSRVRTQRDCYVSSDPTLISFKIELESIVGSYPNEIGSKLPQDNVDKNRLGTSLDQVELTMIVKSIGADSLSSISNDYERIKFESGSAEEAWHLFCEQVTCICTRKEVEEHKKPSLSFISFGSCS